MRSGAANNDNNNHAAAVVMAKTLQIHAHILFLFRELLKHDQPDKTDIAQPTDIVGGYIKGAVRSVRIVRSAEVESLVPKRCGDQLSSFLF